jgi:NAD+ diphosphatase
MTGMLFTEQARFCPRCGADGLVAPDPKLVDCPQCGLHYYLNSAAAVAGYVLDDRDHLLLARRARDPGKGKLGPPGGFLDFGETAEDAVCREIREETGLIVQIEAYLGSFPNRYHYRDVLYPTLDIFFLCRADSFEPAAALDEVESLVIRPWQEVDPDEIAFESMRLAFDRLAQKCSPGR